MGEGEREAMMSPCRDFTKERDIIIISQLLKNDADSVYVSTLRKRMQQRFRRQQQPSKFVKEPVPSFRDISATG